MTDDKVGGKTGVIEWNGNRKPWVCLILNQVNNNNLPIRDLMVCGRCIGGRTVCQNGGDNTCAIPFY